MNQQTLTVRVKDSHPIKQVRGYIGTVNFFDHPIEGKPLVTFRIRINNKIETMFIEWEHLEEFKE